MNPEKQSNETISSRSACILACNQTEREQQSLSQLSSFLGGKTYIFSHNHCQMRSQLSHSHLVVRSMEVFTLLLTRHHLRCSLNVNC